jgi:phosphoribosylaminoimidazole (AIR) synthetase
MAELVRRGDLSAQERYRTLNMGIGYTLIIPFAQAEQAVHAAPGAFVAGWIERRQDEDPPVIVHPARSA